MAVQATTDDEVANRRQVVLRATHRIFGCLIGGTVGLALLSLSFESFVPWLLALCAGVWIGAHIQSSARGIGYVGTQGTVVFMMKLVQGFGPPASRRRALCRHHGRSAHRARGVGVAGIKTASIGHGLTPTGATVGPYQSRRGWLKSTPQKPSAIRE